MWLKKEEFPRLVLLSYYSFYWLTIAQFLSSAAVYSIHMSVCPSVISQVSSRKQLVPNNQKGQSLAEGL